MAIAIAAAIPPVGGAPSYPVDTIALRNGAGLPMSEQGYWVAFSCRLANERIMNSTLQPYEIRSSIASDHDAIARVWHTSASLPGVGPVIMPTLDELRKRIDLEFAAGWHVTVAACADDILGFVAIKPREAVLDQLFVEPRSLGAGVGRALLAHAITAMPDGFTLFTRATNARARRFYEKAGLMSLKEDVHPRSGEPIIHYGWNIR